MFQMPALIIISVGLAMILLAIAFVVFPKSFGVGRASFATASILVLAAVGVIALGATMRRGPRASTNDLDPPRDDSAANHATRGSMTTRQFFGVSLRVLGAWQIISVIVDIPLAVAAFSMSMGNPNSIVGTVYMAGPVVRGLLGVALLFQGDRLAGLVYRDESPRRPPDPAP